MRWRSRCQPSAVAFGGESASTVTEVVVDSAVSFWVVGLRHPSVPRPGPLHREARNVAAMRGQEKKVKEMEARVF